MNVLDLIRRRAKRQLALKQAQKAFVTLHHV